MRSIDATLSCIAALLKFGILFFFPDTIPLSGLKNPFGKKALKLHATMTLIVPITLEPKYMPVPAKPIVATFWAQKFVDRVVRKYNKMS